MPEPWVIVLCSVIAGLLVLFFVILFIMYRFIFFSPRKGQLDDFNITGSPNFAKYTDGIKKLIIELKERPFEDLYIQSFDKLKLHARLYENRSSKKIAILFHGYRGTAYRDFCGGAKEAIELGYTVILVDERAHGLSQGHSITFGVREVEDLLSWVKYARERFGNDINLVLIGISMGGATVLAASDKVGDNVKIIADCPYSTPKIIISESIKSIHLSPKIFYPIINLSSKIFAHTNLNKMSAYDSIKNTNNKILIIHGDSDTVVPFEVSKKLYETYPNKIQYEVFPGADHGVSYLQDSERYCRIIREFLNS